MPETTSQDVFRRDAADEEPSTRRMTQYWTVLNSQVLRSVDRNAVKSATNDLLLPHNSFRRARSSIHFRAINPRISVQPDKTSWLRARPSASVVYGFLPEDSAGKISAEIRRLFPAVETM